MHGSLFESITNVKTTQSLLCCDIISAGAQCVKDISVMVNN